MAAVGPLLAQVSVPVTELSGETAPGRPVKAGTMSAPCTVTSTVAWSQTVTEPAAQIW